MLMLQIGKKDNLKQQQENLLSTFREIERLLTAVYCPKEVAVMHCKGHSRDKSKVAKGNQLAVKPERWHLMKPLHYRGL